MQATKILNTPRKHFKLHHKLNSNTTISISLAFKSIVYSNLLFNGFNVLSVQCILGSLADQTWQT